jgi:hypothetical protein
MIIMWNNINPYYISNKTKEIRTNQTPNPLRKMYPLTHYFFVINNAILLINENKKEKK